MRVKKYIFFLLALGLACTSKSDDRILGIWEVQSKFYRATYKIEKKGKKLVGRILYYNDDTTVLRETGTDKDIFLTNLTYKKGAYVDAISGATKTQKESLTIKIRHKDTLEVKTYIMHKPLIEFWTRKKSQKPQ